ncbi:MAG: VCBS repeat-containing protein [Planctomycetes bacterium]|nr:VCBS repeat-containing protein [Planctomycetota bacterium]
MRPPLRSRSFLALALLALAAFGLSHLRAGEDDLPLRVWTIRLPGNELGCDLADMDGDGDLDLVVAHMTDTTSEARTLSVFLQGTKAQRFAAKPTRTFVVPADACAYVAGEFDPAPGAEIALLCPTRVLLLKSKGPPVEILKEPGFFDYPERGGLPVWDLARDLDGDGLLELIVPTKRGYAILGRGNKDKVLTKRSEVRLEIDQRFGPTFETKLLNRLLTSTLRLRRVVHTDLNADGRQDLIAVNAKGLARYLQRPDGTFPERPDRIDPFKITRGKEEEGGKGGGFTSVRLNLEDVNGDGRADLLATRTMGEIGLFSSLRTQQLLFLAQKDLPQTWDERKPDAVLNLKGISADPLLIDWDGDGRKDLVLSTYRMDMLTNVKRVLADSLTITYLIFLQRKGKAGVFEDEPDVSFDVEVPLESLQQRGGTQAVIFTADLDGDGVRDQIARRPDGSLVVARGRIERDGDDVELSFSENPVKITVPRTEPPRVVDLDGDGKSELILEPFAGDDAAARTLRVVGVAQ